MAIDKSLKQHYETQAGVKNFLGKQKMVKAPKYWLSKPGHVKAKLAYITDEEEQILIDKNLYGSLRGRPNKGPAGLPSLQGGDFGAGGGGGSSGGGGGEGRPHGGWSAPAPTVTQTAAMEDIGARDTIAGLTPGPSPHGDREANIKEQAKLNIQQMIAKQQEEKFGPLADPTKFGEIAEKDLRTQKEKDEDWEKAQDWDKVKDLADRGHDFKEIQSAMDKGLLMKEDATRRQSLIDRGLASLKNLIPKTGLERSLLSNLTSGKMFDPKSMAFNALKNMALRKLGLGFLNPFLGIASLFGFDPFKGIQTAFTNKFAKKPAFDVDAASKLGLYDTGPVDSTLTARDVGTFESDIPTQIALGKKGVFESGRELLGLKPVMVAHGGRIDKPLMGRSRDI